jgi:mRNA-degrading endonuclease RelE of RelBE toxin-antitoxin system
MEAAKKQLASIKDRRIREKIVERAEALAIDPEKQGKELGGDLEGYRSVRAIGQRYRIIYRVDGENIVVVVRHFDFEMKTAALFFCRCATKEFDIFYAM